MATAETTTKAPLTDEQLDAINPALKTLVLQLEEIASREPSVNTARLAASLAEYFRTPD